MLTDIVLLCFNQALITFSLQLENHMNQLCQIMCAYPIQTAQWVRSIHIDYLQFMLLAFFPLLSAWPITVLKWKLLSSSQYYDIIHNNCYVLMEE